MKHWNPPKRPAEFTEYQLIESILTGEFAIDSTLPAERELSEMLGVTRPTLREVLQRMERDGWVDIQQGKATRVRNYFVEGNFGVLSSIVQHEDHVTSEFTGNLLMLRRLLAPTYTRLAVENDSEVIRSVLIGWETLEEKPEAYSVFDWNFHHQLAVSSGNPVFPLILNGFESIYLVMGRQYYALSGAYQLSNYFYESLQQPITGKDGLKAEKICTEVMAKSEIIWRQLLNGVDEEENI